MIQQIWTLYEDCALNILTQEKKINRTKWSQISRILQSQYGVIGKSPKDCRERWQSQMQTNIRKDEWTEQEKQLLYNYHNQFGNKWSKMAQVIKRSDNCIKNHFYSTTRKSMRKVNKYIIDKKIKDLKGLKPSLLSKILTTAEQKFTVNSKNYSIHVIENCITIKNILLNFEYIVQKQNYPESKMKQLIQILIQIRSCFNKKNKKKMKELINPQVDSRINKNLEIEKKDNIPVEEYPTVESQNAQSEKIEQIYIPFNNILNQQKQVYELEDLQQQQQNNQLILEEPLQFKKGKQPSFFDQFFEPDLLMHQI